MKVRDHYGGISEVGKASVHRMADAQAAFDKGRWRACQYLAGYSVECRLKVALMKKFNCLTLKELAAAMATKGVVEGAGELYTHSLEKLLTLTGRTATLRNNPVVVKQFYVVNRWTPAWRYTADLSNPGEAEQFLESARGMVHWVDVNV